MLLVTGAASVVGRHLVHALTQGGAPVRAIVRPHAAVTADELGTADLLVGDLANGHTLDAALSGVETVVLITRPHAELLAHDRTVLAAARQHGVRRVLKLSVAGASAVSPLSIGRWHWESESLLAASPLDYLIVRAHRPHQHLCAQVDSLCTQHAFYGCQGDGEAVDVDVRDVADVLARLAFLPVLGRETLEVTGGVPHRAAEVAQRLSESMGCPVRYVDCAPEDYVRALLAGGLSQQRAEDRAAWQLLLRQGRFAVPTDTVQRLTGRPPRSLDAFALEFADSIRYPAVSHSATVDNLSH
jgi:NAD(P)H dehydrogenase (quinone)